MIVIALEKVTLLKKQGKNTSNKELNNQKIIASPAHRNHMTYN
jgi:hypothetical protein